MQEFKRPIILLSLICVIVGVAAWFISDIVDSAKRSSSKAENTKTDDRVETQKSTETRRDDAEHKQQVDTASAPEKEEQKPIPPAKFDPRDYFALYRRGKHEEFSKQFVPAMKDFNDSLKYNPLKSATATSPKSNQKTLRAWAYQEIGYIYCVEGKYREGVQALSEAIKIRPNYVQNYVNRGIAYERLGDRSSAKADHLTAKSLSVQDLKDDCLTAPVSLTQTF